jgi:hypothetical protein
MLLLELVTSSGLGSLLGMRHALEPDHLRGRLRPS